MKKNVVITLFIALLLVSCSSGNSGESVKIKLADNLSGSAINEKFTLNDIVDEISFVQLADNDSLGAIYPFLWNISDNGDLVCVDFSNKMVINIHDKDGKLISTFNNVGKGPAEYLYPASVAFDGDDEVMVLASMEKAMFRYDKKGLLKSKVTIPAILDAKDLGDGRYLARASITDKKDWDHQVVIIDSEGNVVDKFLPIDTTIIDKSLYNAMAMKGDGGFNFSIQNVSKNAYYNYNIEKNEVRELCEFDLGDYGVKMDSQFTSTDEYYKNFLSAIDIAKVNDYLILNFIYDNKHFHDIWNIKSGELIGRRSSPFGGGGTTYFDYKLPNGNSIKLNLDPSFSHNDELYYAVMPSLLVDAGVEGINLEGNIVFIKMKFKK